jgi:myo-inositol-hexaphosphate 3-phosphohydrolase
LKRDVRLITEIHELRVELKSIVDTESAKVKLKFRIALNFEAGIDGASETDGVDLVTTALPGFPRGVLIVQDGRNIAPPEPQNFKLINWAQVEALLAR